MVDVKRCYNGLLMMMMMMVMMMLMFALCGRGVMGQ